MSGEDIKDFTVMKFNKKLREEEKRERSKGPETTSNVGLSRNMNIQSSKSNQIPKGNRSLSPGVPSVQDVDRIDDS